MKIIAINFQSACFALCVGAVGNAVAIAVGADIHTGNVGVLQYVNTCCGIFNAVEVLFGGNFNVYAAALGKRNDVGYFYTDIFFLSLRFFVKYLKYAYLPNLYVRQILYTAQYQSHGLVTLWVLNLSDNLLPFALSKPPIEVLVSALASSRYSISLIELAALTSPASNFERS